MAEIYQFKIVTPEGIAYEQKVRHILFPREDGLVGILANHAPYLAYSSGGKCVVDQENGDKIVFAVGTGFIEIKNNQAIFLTTSFEESA